MGGIVRERWGHVHRRNCSQVPEQQQAARGWLEGRAARGHLRG